ncbi:MAG: DUF3866 family protein [Peptococcia bacterium]|jgi:hypothetical protein
MINRAIGIVAKIIYQSQELYKLRVLVNGVSNNAYAFPQQCGELKVGDVVLLNTTAVDLGLGSGGYHFVMGLYSCATGAEKNRLASSKATMDSPGHIMKVRYTPFQVKVCAVEEEDSPAHGQFLRAESLEGLPVISGSLHSMLVPCVCGLKAVRENLRIAYVMTDGGALPLALSEAVRTLKKMQLLCGTITVGHAYGGDLEAVNLYSGLLAAKEILRAEVIVVLMGPGVVGTNTKWGTTALELGQIINAVEVLSGQSYTIPRLSFADGRERHYGISHHTLTALNDISLALTRLVLPELSSGKKEYLLQQLRQIREERYQLFWGQGWEGIRFAQKHGLSLSSMGRSFTEDPAFFLAAAAVGDVVARQRAIDAG